MGGLGGRAVKPHFLFFSAHGGDDERDCAASCQSVAAHRVLPPGEGEGEGAGEGGVRVPV